MLNGLERALDDALHAVADVVEDGKMVPGGGAPEIELSLRLKEYAATLKGREQLAVTKFAQRLWRLCPRLWPRMPVTMPSTKWWI